MDGSFLQACVLACLYWVKHSNEVEAGTGHLLCGLISVLSNCITSSLPQHRLRTRIDLTYRGQTVVRCPFNELGNQQSGFITSWTRRNERSACSFIFSIMQQVQTCQMSVAFLKKWRCSEKTIYIYIDKKLYIYSPDGRDYKNKYAHGVLLKNSLILFGSILSVRPASK